MVAKSALLILLALTANCDITNRIGLRRDLSRRLTAHAKVDVRGCVLTDDDALAPGGYCLARGSRADLRTVQKDLGLSLRAKLGPRDPTPMPKGCKTLAPFDAASGVDLYVSAYPTGWGDFDYVILYAHPATNEWCVETHYGWG